jgi:hypothetical protein
MTRPTLTAPRALLCALTAAAPSAGCADVPCAEGTHEEAGTCVANLAPQCGPGTDLQGGFCVPSAGGAVCGEGTHSEAGVCLANIVAAGNASRLISAEFSAPPTLAPLAGGILTDALSTGEELVLVGIYEPVADSIRVFGGGGERNTDGSYRLDLNESFDAPAARNEAVIDTEPVALYFPAFSGGSLRLEDARFTNLTVAATEGVQIATAGELAGVVTPENADALFIDLIDVTFLELLQNLGEVPDVDLDGDGTNESWTLALSFAAEIAWLL